MKTKGALRRIAKGSSALFADPLLWLGPICLEGNAGCGKTACGMALAARCDGVFLAEYTELMQPAQHALLMDSFELKLSHNSYAVWEKAERYRLGQSVEAVSKTLIMDTSLVSVIAFELARIAFGFGGSLISLVSGYIELLASHRVLLPSRMILLYTSEAMRQKRLAIRDTCHPFLVRQDVSEYLNQQRMTFFEHYVPGDAWAILDTSRLSVEAAADRASELLASLTSHDLRESFSTWLTDILCHGNTP